MDVLLHSLALLVLVAVTGFSTRAFPKLPLPLLQIALGAVVAWPAHGLHVSLEPDVFMGLFIPPLLFASAQQMPQRELSVLKAPILLMATGLVATTVLAVGAAAHALLPLLSWPLCFVLAAVLSPTDAVAFGALIAGRRLPARMLRILEGEALVNDASGLVAVKLSLAAVAPSRFLPDLPSCSSHEDDCIHSRSGDAVRRTLRARADGRRPRCRHAGWRSSARRRELG